MAQQHSQSAVHAVPATAAPTLSLPPEAKGILKWLGLTEEDLQRATGEQVAGWVGMLIYSILPKQAIRTIKGLPTLVRSIFGGMLTLIFRFISPATTWGKRLDEWVTDVVGAVTTLAEAQGDVTSISLPKAWVDTKAPVAAKLFSNLAKLTADIAGAINAELLKIAPEQCGTLLTFLVEIPEAEQEKTLKAFGEKPATLQMAMLLLGMRQKDAAAELAEAQASDAFWGQMAAPLWQLIGVTPGQNDPWQLFNQVLQATQSAQPGQVVPPKKKRGLL